MKRIVFLLSTILFALSSYAQTADCDSIDFFSVVDQVERNYSGFPTKVTQSNIAQYNAMKNELWDQVKNGKREGYNAVGEYLSWFNDMHLFGGIPSSHTYLKTPDYSTIDYNPQFVSKKLSETTYLLRVPTFSGDSITIEKVKTMAKEYLDSDCENLIIDIRGNGGGIDWCFDPLTDMIYTHPFTMDGIEIRATPDISQYLREAYAAQGNRPSWAPAMADSIDTGKYEFISVPAFENRTLEYDTIYQTPKKVAIIIDGNVASSAEQFVILSRSCSDKVTIYGRDNTLGCIDYSNLRRYDMPCNGITSWIPISRSTRLRDGRGIDGIGIEPDVRITLPLPKQLTDNADEWVEWIASQMEDRL